MDKQSFIIRDYEIRSRAAHAVNQLEPDPLMQVTIKPYRKNKSQEQLGYLWAGVLPSICQHLEDTGMAGEAHYTPEDIYDWMISEYAEMRVVELGGKQRVVMRSASKMNTAQMSDFIDKIIQHAAMYMDLVIPPPDWREHG